ncbi:MAG: FxsC protein [Chromatiales bacterium]|jgi:FxsC-like protein
MARFFLSYARDNWDGGYLKRFLDDLCEDVRQYLPGQDASFRDNDQIPLGARWEPTLVEALHTCNAFIAVLSPSYFESEYCAKEWDAFSQRLKRYAPDADPPLLLPVFWVPPVNNLPDAVVALQYKIEQFGAEYAEKGLFTIIKNKSNYESVYETFREAFREALVNAINNHPLPDALERPGFNQLSNPFKPTTVAAAVAPALHGPTHLRLALVAGNRNEIDSIQGAPDVYGANEREWAPFVDEDGHKQSLASQVQLIAARKKITSDFIDLDSLIPQIESAIETNYLVAMLVDVWSLLLPKYRDKMRSYDERQWANCAVIIPDVMHTNDTASVHRQLDEAVEQAFPIEAAKTAVMQREQDSVSYRRNVKENEFERILSETLIKLQAQIRKFVDVQRRIKGSGPAKAPEISGI